jgi:chemotaxis signal transduction protein
MSDDFEELDKSVLARRAEALAKPRTDTGAVVETVAILRFSLMSQDYAVPLDAVEAVLRIGEIVSIPLTPKHIQGVIRRRGQTIALVSLRHYFHPEYEGLVDSDFAIIVVADGKRFALQVEDIEGVVRIPKSAFLPAPDNFDTAQSPFVIAVTTEGLTILDVGRLVAAGNFGLDNPRAADRGNA